MQDTVPRTSWRSDELRIRAEHVLRDDRTESTWERRAATAMRACADCPGCIPGGGTSTGQRQAGGSLWEAASVHGSLNVRNRLEDLKGIVRTLTIKPELVLRRQAETELY